MSLNKSFEEQRKSLSLELKRHRAIAKSDKQSQTDRFLDAQLDLWIESVQFCITELEVWERENDYVKCQEYIEQARECLDQLHKLLY